MKALRWILGIGCWLIVAPLDAGAVTHQWSRALGDADYQSVNSVATDADGNVIVTGWFSGTVDFGGGSLTSAGGADVFVAKYDATGAHLWSKRFGDASEQTATSITTDSDGYIILTGLFMGSVSFGGGTRTSAGSYDVFLAKLDPDGIHEFSERYGNSTAQAGYSVTTDADDNVILVGNFYGEIDLGGDNLTSSGFNDVFVAKFDQEADHLWSQRFGDSNDQLGTSVTTDASGNVIIGGWYNGSIDFGGGDLTSTGVGDIFLAKLDPDGAHQWSQRFGSGSNIDQYAYGVATDAGENVFLTGGFYGSVDFGGGTLTSSGAGVDFYLAKFDPSGAHLWSRRCGDGTDQYGYSVDTDNAGAVFVTGSMDGTVDFGGGALTSGGAADVFVAKYTSAGAHEWSERFGTGGFQVGQGIASDASGSVIVGGNFEGSVDFGGDNLTSAGNLDGFVVKFGGSVTGAFDGPALAGLTLSAFPNPIVSSAVIRFAVPSAGPVSVAIYDLRGAHVATLVNETRGPGTHLATWNRRAGGKELGPGVYFARVTHPAGSKSHRMVVLR
jgi:hypothetical protein